MDTHVMELKCVPLLNSYVEVLIPGTSEYIWR